MKNESFMRSEALIGEEGMARLVRARVILFGIGGVGSYAAEALARSGIGALTFVDGDTVAMSNINRQLVALRSTIGKNKAEVMRARALDINPDCNVHALDMFYSIDNANEIDFSNYDYVIDAIDTVSSKLLLIERAKAAGVPVISCMGAGNKLEPTMFRVSDVFSTEVCPLARVMRHELKKRGISSLKVVYSTEKPAEPAFDDDAERTPGKRQTPGSVPFAPSVAGLVLAGEVIKDIALSRLT